MKSVDTLRQHLSDPGKSFNAYLGEQRLALGESVRNKGRIYLDTKYWILLRDATIGRENDPSVNKLLAALREGVSSGKLLCPIGADTFTEILSQTDKSTLMQSVRLVDELSQGVALLFHQERFLLELLSFVRARMPGETGHDPKLCAWTKVAFILGFLIPGNTGLPIHQEEAIQKAVLDDMWNASLTDIVDATGAVTICARKREPDISNRLNENKLKYRPSCKSYKEAFLSEIAGLLDTMWPEISDTLCYLVGQHPKLKMSKNVASALELASSIHRDFRLNRLSSELPFIRIQATLHAAIWWDTPRKYRSTDTHDILHATAALPYFHIFLTERALKHLITRKDLALDKLYGCCVIAEPTEAAKTVVQLLNL